MSANGRQQQRRNRCSTGSPAERRHPTVLETRTVARTVRERREEIPGHFGSRPANAYLEGQILTRSVKRVTRGFRNEEYLATAIFPGLGGYRSTPSLALRPNPCYPPETPKSLIFGYRCLSFALASALMNCQSTPPPRALRSSSHALRSLRNVS